ncbi:MAG: glycosyltransferase family 4 protein [Candidatus Kapaibacteriales bacterium]
MKIAYISTFYPYRGGIAQFNALLYRQLELLGECRAITFSRQYPDLLFPGKTQMAGPEDNVDHIDSERLIDTVNPLTWLKAAKSIAEWEPDICITKFWLPYFAPSLGKILGKARKSGSKNISIIDNAIPHEKRPGDMQLTKYFLKQNDVLVAMSSSVENDLRTLAPDKEILRFPHPLYDHFHAPIEKELAREKLGIPKDKTVLLFFGFIRKYKGLDLLLQAMPHLAEEYHLLIAGEPYGDFADYDSIVKEHGLSERVTQMVHYISDQQVSEVFSASDIGALPYRSATQSGITAIAFHYGTPMLATDVGSLRELIEPFGAGEIIPSATPDNISKGLDTMKQKGLNSYGSGIQEFREKYTWQKLAETIVAKS